MVMRARRANRWVVGCILERGVRLNEWGSGFLKIDILCGVVCDCLGKYREFSVDESEDVVFIGILTRDYIPILSQQ